MSTMKPSMIPNAVHICLRDDEQSADMNGEGRGYVPHHDKSATDGSRRRFSSEDRDSSMSEAVSG